MPEILVPDRKAITLDAYDLAVPSQVNRSQWGGSSKVVGLPGAEVWTAKITIDGLATEESEWPWRAFLLALKGQQNWFRLRMTCQRHIGPMPVVDTAAGDGYTLPLTGMAPSTTILRAGQWMTVPLGQDRYRLVGLTDDLITDAAGRAVAQFSPALRVAPATGAVIETASPFMQVRKADGSAGFSYSDAIAGRSLDLEEAL